MSVFKILRRFSRDEDGAVTVDWVVLTAAVIGLALGAMAAMTDVTTTLTDMIDADVSGILGADD